MKHSDIAHYRQLTYLRRHFTAKSRRFPPVLEPAAMVDIVLLVLMFFVLSSSYVSRPGIRLNLPQTDYVEALPMNSMVVTVSQRDFVFLNDQRMNFSELKDALKRLRFQYPDRTLVIEAGAQVKNERLVSVFQQAKEAGWSNVALATRFVEAEVAIP